MNPNRKGPEKLLVFPYDYGFAPVVRHVEWRSRFSDLLLASFKGSGLCGHDGGIADEAGDLGIVVESDFDSCLQKCDSVLFLEPNLPLSFKDDIQPLIERATANKKNIYLSWSVPGEATNAISLICATRGVEFWDFAAGSSPLEDLADAGPAHEGLEPISTPVVAVMGIAEDTNKFATEMVLTNLFKGMGYKVQLLSSRFYTELFGIDSVPRFLFSSGCHEAEKILRLNRLVRCIENLRKPDIIVIGIPGGALPINARIHNDFGIICYEICQGVPPDFTILSVFPDSYQGKSLSSMCDLIQARFGVEIKAINVCNRKIDWTVMENLKPERIHFLSRSSEAAEKGKIDLRSRTDIPVVNLLEESDAHALVDQIIELLSHPEPAVTF